MSKESLPKREDITVESVAIREEPPSIKLYGWLLAFAALLLFAAFVLAKPDWPGFFLNLATEIVGAVIILALVERKLRSHELEHLKSTATNLQTQLYFLVFPNARKLADYLERSSAKYDRLASALYVERPELEQRIRNEKGSFLFLGAPGSGKTTGLQRYYVSICKKTISNLSKGKVPVFMPARWVNPDIEFVGDTLRLHFERDSEITERQIERYLRTGRVTLFVDGLDEVKPDARESVVRVLSAFKQRWPDNQLIVSSRDHCSETSLLDLNIVRIPELTLEEHARFMEIYEQYKKKQT